VVIEGGVSSNTFQRFTNKIEALGYFEQETDLIELSGGLDLIKFSENFKVSLTRIKENDCYKYKVCGLDWLSVNNAVMSLYSSKIDSSVSSHQEHTIMLTDSEFSEESQQWLQ
jgi:hypothetical protein